MTRTKPATKWTFAVTGWHPTRLNQMIGRHFAVVAKLKRRDRANIQAAAFGLGIPPATGKRRVTLTIVLGPRQRGGDPDCYWKSCLDAMVHLGLLKNDSRQWVELMPVKFERGQDRASLITLEDIG